MKNKPIKFGIEQPKAMKIAEIFGECQDVKTFTFKEKIKAVPGQIILLWLPRLGMKPFGVSYLDDQSFKVTICQVGPFTEELFKKQVGDYVGIQGPYGHGFRLDKKNAVLVAGGYGAAPLAFLAEVLVAQGTKVTLIIGAKSEERLVYRNRFQNSQVKLINTTEDGSCGQKGYATDALTELLKQDKTIDMVYTVGPEMMAKKVIGITDQYHVDCQLSLDRYIKCGFGVCGQCAVDDVGVPICTKGPAFDKEYVKKYITEFGKYHRDGTGAKIPY